jgi:hypothetical protein
MKEYLLLAAFMIPTLMVLAAAAVTVSHADGAARELARTDIACGKSSS